MNRPPALFELIKSLSQSEKRHIKLTASAAKKNSNLMRLFDVIERQQKYDELSLQRHFAATTAGKQLHVTKNHLLELVLKSLRTYHRNASVDATLKDLLRDIEILFRKDLMDICLHRLAKAEQLAIEHEKQTALLELLAWKRKLLLAKHSSFEVRDDLSQIEEQEQRCLDNIKTQSELWQLTANIFHQNSTHSPAFAKNPLLKSAKNVRTVQANILRYHVLFADAYIQGNMVSAERAVSGLIALLERHPQMIQDDPGAYFTAINNLVGLKLAVKQIDVIPQLLEKIRTTLHTYQIKHNNPIITKHTLRTYSVELEMYRDSRQIAPGIRLIETIATYLEENDTRAPVEYKILFYYQFAYLYFLNNDYRRALHWLGTLVKGKFGQRREDIQSYAKWLTLIIHYELGNTTVLKYAVDTCRRFLKLKHELRPFEKTLLNFFSRLSLAAPSQHHDMFKQLYHELFQTPGVQITDAVLDYLDFKSWVESKQ